MTRAEEEKAKAIGIFFGRHRAEHFLDCLTRGKPISPGASGGWTVADMPALAGAGPFSDEEHSWNFFQECRCSATPKPFAFAAADH